jgi:hypothetical protein
MIVTCPTRELLLSLEQGELDDAPAAEIDAHLRECQTCRAILGELRQTDPDAALMRRVFETTGTRTLETPAAEPVSAAMAPEPRAPDAAEDELERPVRIRRSRTSAWPIPDYERLLLCGEGSYGAVWAVRDRVGAHRAMKVIDLKRLAQVGVRCHEMAALETYCRKIGQHPYLITVHHVGVTEGLLYYTMELADDCSASGSVRESLPRNYRPMTLETVIREGRLRPDIAVEIARRLLKGLSELHSLDLLHRDVKPSNIVFVDRSPKLADIGILAPDSDVVRRMGTPRYMPPDAVIDKSADTFALGRVLEEMLFGFEAARDKKPKHYPDLDAMNWDMERVGRVVGHAGSATAKDRYLSAAAMLEDLEACRNLADGSLLDELEPLLRPTPPGSSRVLLRLGLAFIDRIPWVAGLIVALYAISKWLG